MNLLTLQSFVSRFLQMTYNDFDAMQLAVKEYHATVDQMQSTCNDTCLLREIERDDLKYSEIGRPI